MEMEANEMHVHSTMSEGNNKMTYAYMYKNVLVLVMPIKRIGTVNVAIYMYVQCSTLSIPIITKY